MQIERIVAQDVRQKVTAGSALLVCAYDDDQKFKDNHLEGAISFEAFRNRLGTLPRDRAIIFYCA